MLSFWKEPHCTLHMHLILSTILKGNSSDQIDPFVTTPHPDLPSTHPLSFVSVSRPQFFSGKPCVQLHTNTPVLAYPTARDGHAHHSDQWGIDGNLLGSLGSLLCFPITGIKLRPSSLFLSLYLERDRICIPARAIIQLWCSRHRRKAKKVWEAHPELNHQPAHS